jgi:hypothetical protein
MRQSLMRRLQAFFAPSSSKESRTSRRPRLETLEDRTAPSVSAAYAGTVSVAAGPNINTSKAAGEQSEVTIAVNPANPANIITAPNDLPSLFRSPGRDRVFVTTDAGATWKAVTIPMPGGATDGFGDPTVVFDRTGRAVYSHLALDTNGNLVLATAASTDGGLTWKAGKPKVPVGAFGFSFNDKEFLAVGPDWTDLTKDRFYLTWHESNIIYASNSADGLTWSKPVKVSDSTVGTNIASQIGVGPNGELYIVWDDFGTTGESHVMFDRSFNGGKTWGKDQLIATTNVNVFDDPFSGGRYEVPAQPFRGIWTLPYIDVDRSNGPNHGRVYVSFLDAPNGIGNATDHNNTDVFLIHSDNAGDLSGKPTFSNRVRVNDDTGNATQFFSAMAVDQSTGLVGVSWYDTRNDPNNVRTEYWGAVSTDGGNSFLPNFKFSAGSTDIRQSDFTGNDYGDYSGLRIVGGTLYPVWADGSNSTNNSPDGNILEVYTAPSAVTSTGGLTVTATGGAGNDTYTVRLDPSGKFVQFFENNPSMTGQPDLTVGKASLRTIVVNGNAGNDTVVLDFTNGNPLSSAVIQFDGGDGNDTLRITGSSASLTLPANAITFLGGNGANTLDLSLAGALTMPGNGVVFTPGPGDDTLSLTATSLTVTGTTPFAFDGGAGNDTVMLSVGDLTLPNGGFVFTGGAGNDRFVTSAANIALPANSTSPGFTFAGGDGDDVLTMTAASLNLPAGGFRFDGGNGNDRLQAAFNSVVIPDLPTGPGPIFTFDGAAGNDTLALTGTTLALPANGFVYTAGDGDDRLELASPTPFANPLPGVLTGNLFNGGPGADTLALTAASLTLPSAGFTFTGGADDDVLEISATQITAPAGAGPTFTFTGGDGNDRLVLKGATLKLSGAGFAFTGGDGNDRLDAAFSKVEVSGAGAAFTFDAGAGNDVLSLSATGTLELPAGAFSYTAGDGDDTLQLAFTQLKGVTSGLVFDGGAGNDFMSMTAASLTLPANGFTFLGGAGDDRLSFATSNLSVTGPAGSAGFIYDGQDGNDTLTTPGAGTRNWLFNGLNQGTMNTGLFFRNVESVTGGDGADNFVLLPGGSFPAQLDGAAGVDTLDLSRFTNVNVTLTGASLGGFNTSFLGSGAVAGSAGSINNIVIAPSPLNLLQGLAAGGAWGVAAAGGSYASSGASLTFRGFSTLLGGAGADAFLVDMANANAVPTTGLLLDGAGGLDSLLVGGSAGNDSFVVGTSSVTVNGRTITFARGEALSLLGGAGNDSFNATATSMAFSSLVMRGDAGSDSFLVAPSATTALQVFGDAPTSRSGGDSLRLLRLGTVLVGPSPGRTTASATLSFLGRQSIFFAGIENFDGGGTLISPN